MEARASFGSIADFLLYAFHSVIIANVLVMCIVLLPIFIYLVTVNPLLLLLLAIIYPASIFSRWHFIDHSGMKKYRVVTQELIYFYLASVLSIVLLINFQVVDLASLEMANLIDITPEAFFYGFLTWLPFSFLVTIAVTFLFTAFSVSAWRRCDNEDKRRNFIHKRIAIAAFLSVFFAVGLFLNGTALLSQSRTSVEFFDFMVNVFGGLYQILATSFQYVIGLPAVYFGYVVFTGSKVVTDLSNYIKRDRRFMSRKERLEELLTRDE